MVAPETAALSQRIVHGLCISARPALVLIFSHEPFGGIVIESNRTWPDHAIDTIIQVDSCIWSKLFLNLTGGVYPCF